MPKKLTIYEMRQIAKGLGGKCLSNEYVNADTKLKWQCSKGHIWEAKPSGVKSGNWCSKCVGVAKLSISEMHNIAKERGGECLSNEYVNNKTKLKWQCSKGHVWEAKPNNVKNGQWCLVCSGSAKSTIEDMRRIAEERGGKLLSRLYLNAHEKLKWQCKEGHIWEAIPNSIKNGRWCPICLLRIGEKICKEYFEIIFDNKFPKTKPHWLVNSDGMGMELDGFCNKLKLAFEYQGMQHYKKVKFFHRDGKTLEKRIKDDTEKRYLCEKNGIKLIEIPYTVPFDKIYEYIIAKCREDKIKIPKHKKYFYKELKIYSSSKLEDLMIIAQERGGRCLSSEYINSKTKLEWQCRKGHVWEATPDGIKGGYWCPKCAGLVKLTIEEMRAIAGKRGGKCLSDKYVNSVSKLKWQCSQGHIWEAKPSGVKSGKWCPVCAGKKPVENK